MRTRLFLRVSKKSKYAKEKLWEGVPKLFCFPDSASWAVRARGSIKMGEVKEKELFINPYVIQMDKFAGSLKHLSETFLGLEKGRRTLTGE